MTQNRAEETTLESVRENQPEANTAVEQKMDEETVELVRADESQQNQSADAANSANACAAVESFVPALIPFEPAASASSNPSGRPCNAALDKHPEANQTSHDCFEGEARDTPNSDLQEGAGAISNESLEAARETRTDVEKSSETTEKQSPVVATDAISVGVGDTQTQAKAAEAREVGQRALSSNTTTDTTAESNESKRDTAADLSVLSTEASLQETLADRAGMVDHAPMPKSTVLPGTEEEVLAHAALPDQQDSSSATEDKLNLAQEEALEQSLEPNLSKQYGSLRSRFLSHLSLFAGLAFALALLLFAAANWAGWDPSLRIGFFGLLMLLPGVAAAGLARKREASLSLRRKRLEDITATAFGLMLGLLLAVIGQTYQSGEGAATLLAIWSALLTPWLIFVRRPIFFTLWFITALAALLFLGNETLAGEALLERLTPGMLFAAAVAFVLAIAARRFDGAIRRTAVIPSLCATVLSAGLAALALLGFSEAAGLVLVPIYLIVFALLSVAFAISMRPELLSLIVFGIAAILEGIWFHYVESSTTDPLIYIPGIAIAMAGLIGLWRIGKMKHRGRFGRMPLISEVPVERSAERLSLAPAVASVFLAAFAVLLLLLLVQSVLDLPNFECGMALGVFSLVLEVILRFKNKKSKESAATCEFEGTEDTSITPTQHGFLRFRSPLSLALALFAAAGITLVFLDALDSDKLDVTIVTGLLAFAAAILFRSRLALFAAMALPAAAVQTYAPVITAGAALFSGLLIAVPRLIGPAQKKSQKQSQKQPVVSTAFGALLWWLPAFLWMSWFGSGMMHWLYGQLATEFEQTTNLMLTIGALLGVLGGTVALLRAGFEKLFAIAFLAISAAILLRFGPDASPLVLALAGMTPIVQAVQGEAVTAANLRANTHFSIQPLHPAHFILFFWSLSHAHYWLLPSASGTNLLLHAALDQLFFAVLFGLLLLTYRFTSAKTGLAWHAVEGSEAEGLRLNTAEPNTELKKNSQCLRFDRVRSIDCFDRAALLLLTVIIVSAGIIRDEGLLETGDVFTAKLAPVDPRDLLMGDYMSLRYEALQRAPSLFALKEEAPEVAEAKPTRSSTKPEPRHIRYKACFGLQTTTKDAQLRSERELKLLAVIASNEPIPQGTVLVRPYDPTTRTAKLPARWFFSSGEAALWERAAYAELRCDDRRCLLAALRDAEGEPIHSETKSFFDRLVNGGY